MLLFQRCQSLNKFLNGRCARVLLYRKEHKLKVNLSSNTAAAAYDLKRTCVGELPYYVFFVELSVAIEEAAKEKELEKELSAKVRPGFCRCAQR